MAYAVYESIQHENQKGTKMKKIFILTLVGVACVACNASIWSAPVKATANGIEKVAAKLGIRATEKAVVCGESKQAAMPAERKVAKSAAHGTINAVGTATEDHPEVVGRIEDSGISPIRHLAIVGMLVVMAMAAWFLRPFVLLARNARALALIRKAATMRDGEVVDVTPFSASNGNVLW